MSKKSNVLYDVESYYNDTDFSKYSSKNKLRSLNYLFPLNDYEANSIYSFSIIFAFYLIKL